jgi:hypothetical protein
MRWHNQWDPADGILPMGSCDHRPFFTGEKAYHSLFKYHAPPFLKKLSCFIEFLTIIY